MIKTVAWVSATIVLLPGLLYVPAIQRVVVGAVLHEVNASNGLTVTVGDFRLRWPLIVEVSDVAVTRAVATDTMASMSHGRVEVSLLPLLTLKLRAEARFDSLHYAMGGADSSLWLTAHVKRLTLSPSTYDLATNHISLGHARLHGGDVALTISPSDSTVSDYDSASGSAMLAIDAHLVELTDVTYRMAMLPTIDSLGVRLDRAQLRDASIDLRHHRVHARSLIVDSVAATCLTPAAATPTAQTAVADTTATATQPWTVTADAIGLTARSAHYGQRGEPTSAGLNLNDIRVSDIAIRIDSFYNCGSRLRVPLRQLHCRERCGLTLDASGRFAIDSVGMHANDFKISTLFSQLSLDATMGLGAPADTPDLPLRLKARGSIGMADIALALPAVTPIVNALPPHRDMAFDINLHGSPKRLYISTIRASMPEVVTVDIGGHIDNPVSLSAINGSLSFAGHIGNINPLKPTLLNARLSNSIHVPSMALNGHAAINRGSLTSRIAVTTASGRMLLNASGNASLQAYDMTLRLDSFPVGTILPGLGIGDVSASLAASGHGFDIYSPSTASDINLSISHISYLHKAYTGLQLIGRLHNSLMAVDVISLNPDANFDVVLAGQLDKNGFDLTLDGDVRRLDMQALGLSADTSRGTFALKASCKASPTLSNLKAQASISGLEWDLATMNLSTPLLSAALDVSPSSLRADIDNESLHAAIIAPCGLDSFVARMTSGTSLIGNYVARRHIDVDSIQHTLPPFSLQLNAGTNNLINSILENNDNKIGELTMTMSNDSLLRFNASATTIDVGTTKIDTIDIDAYQHGKYIVYSATMNNRPGTFDDFAHVNATGFVANQNFTIFIRQNNIAGETGFKIGLNMAMADSVINLRLTPLKPVVGYKTWNINRDNFIRVDTRNWHIDADLLMSNGNSHLRVATQHDDNAAPDSVVSREDVIVSASGIELADWLAVAPFAPPLQGLVGADIRVAWDAAARSLSGRGSASIDNLTYGTQHVGSFRLDLGVATDSAGVVRAESALLLDSVCVATVSGSINNTATSNPFLLDFAINRLPMRVANPFLPPSTATLGGTLNGHMTVSGSLANPRFDGYIDFDSATVTVDMLATTFRIADSKISVDSSIVRFNDFAINGANRVPLVVNGAVDMRHIISPRLDLAMSTRGMMVVNSRRQRNAQVYGSAYIDADATIKGSLSNLRVNTALTLLEGSNVTYVVGAESKSLAQIGNDEATADMVHFVHLSDSSTIESADTINPSVNMDLNLTARLTVARGATINVDLPTGAQDRASIRPTATLTLTISPFSDMRLTGQIDIDQGWVKVTPPLMTTKQFVFGNNSYVAFTGNPLDPTLSLYAYDTMKANVTESGQDSRLVNFTIGLTVDGSLTNMNTSFDLSTSDDLAVENELQAMSPSQRANQAINMLLYNVYSGPDTRADANIGGNPLFSFLTSQLNAWAANTIKGVDLSFGFNQYDRTTDGTSTTTTSYSYRLTKTLFNDRFKIVVGGNYSTDANLDENFSQNLINDISFEYMLNRSGSMYVKLFRHVGYESILEGEITQTGVGFVYRRKLTRLSDMFRFNTSGQNVTIQ